MEYRFANLSKSNKSHQLCFVSLVVVEQVLFGDNGMDACPPTVSTHQAGEDIAEDNYMVHQMSQCLKPVFSTYCCLI